MATDKKKVRIENGRVLAIDLIKDSFLDFLRNELLEVCSAEFSGDATIGATAVPITATVAQNNKIDVAKAGGPYKGVTGSGNVIKFASADSRLQAVAIPPGAGDVYSVGLETALLDDDPEANADTGEIQYRTQIESIGRVGTPDLVTDNGDGTLTFRVDSVTSSIGKDHTGRQVRVWLKAKSDGGTVGPCSAVEATAIETRTVSLVSTHNQITTVGDFGQQAARGTRSTTASDYIIALIGPTVKLKATEDLRNTAGCWFMGEVTSVATGNPIVTISQVDQRLASFDLSDLGNVLRKDGHGSVKVRVHADSSDNAEPQIEVYDSAAAQRFLVDEAGRMARNVKTSQAVQTDMVPADIIRDYAGNIRHIVDHNGFPMGRRTEIRENWMLPLSSYATSATVANCGHLATFVGGSSPSVRPEAPNFGANGWPCQTIRLVPGTSGFAGISHSVAPLTGSFNYVVIVMEFEASFTVVGGSANSNWWFGLSSNFGNSYSAPSQSLLFKKPSNNAHILALTGDGTTDSTTDTNFSPVANQIHRFRVEFHGSATPIGVALGGAVALFFIDDVLRVTKTSNIPGGASAFMGAYFVGDGGGSVDNARIGPFVAVANRQLSMPAL
jgi:hypothetical protein